MAKAAIKTQAKTKSHAKNSNKPKTAGNQGVEIQHIPLNLLEISPNNVRQVKPSENDDKELFASIRENGLKQNLAGHIDENDRYLIDAGGRRLNALQQLAEQGIINKDYSVPCLIVDESEAILTSTTENTHRTAMHPADQFVAFSQLIDEGRTEEEISLKFGISVDVVKRRLKLARVAPEIMDEFRENNLTLECVMAFTLSDCE